MLLGEGVGEGGEGLLLVLLQHSLGRVTLANYRLVTCLFMNTRYTMHFFTIFY